jgi:hypothetical protein
MTTVTTMRRSNTSHRHRRRRRHLPAAARSVADNAMLVLLFAILLFASISPTIVTDDISLFGGGVQAFAPSSPQLPSKFTSVSSSTCTTTRLYIIGPMIRKMRENAEKKNMPMANPDEVRLEAPGKSLQVTVRLLSAYC